MQPHGAGRPGARAQAHRRARLQHAPANADGASTPPSTAVVLGQVAAAPRRVHHLAGVVLASLIGRGGTPLQDADADQELRLHATGGSAAAPARLPAGSSPTSIIRRGGRGLVRALLQAPLCYEAGGKPTGTLKDLCGWCAARHPGVRLHFAKTGTQVTEDLDATVDAWIAGGLQFANGAAYSYVVVVGTGSAREPWARNLHAAQLAVPLLETLLIDLEAEAKAHARRRHAVACESEIAARRRGTAKAAHAAAPRTVQDATSPPTDSMRIVHTTGFGHRGAALATKTAPT